MPVSVSATVFRDVAYEGARAVLPLGAYTYYRLVNRINGMVADGWGSTGNGDPARQKAWDGSDTQQWRITHRGQGQYSIANRGTGLVLDGGGMVVAGVRDQAVDVAAEHQPAVDFQPGRLTPGGCAVHFWWGPPVRSRMMTLVPSAVLGQVREHGHGAVGGGRPVGGKATTYVNWPLTWMVALGGCRSRRRR